MSAAVRRELVSDASAHRVAQAIGIPSRVMDPGMFFVPSGRTRHWGVGALTLLASAATATHGVPRRRLPRSHEVVRRVRKWKDVPPGEGFVRKGVTFATRIVHGRMAVARVVSRGSRCYLYSVQKCGMDGRKISESHPVPPAVCCDEAASDAPDAGAKQVGPHEVLIEVGPDFDGGLSPPGGRVSR